MQIFNHSAMIKVLKLLPYFSFIPICNFLYKLFFLIPQDLRECIFYLRVPIISAILISIVFPILLNNLLRNVLIMTKRQQIYLGIIAVFLTGRSIIIVANAILENAPTRFGIASVPTLIFPWDYVSSVILGLPLVWGIVFQTHAEKHLTQWSEIHDEKVKDRYEKQLVNNENLISGCLIGLLSALLIFVIDKLFLLFLETFKLPISQIFLFSFQRIGLISLDQVENGYFYRQDNQLLLASGHLAGLSFFLIALILFFAVGYLFRPNNELSSEQGEAPVIIYMMAFLAIVVPIIGTMTFALDLPKFPVILTAICFVAASYWLWDVDYYFELKKSQVIDKADPSDFKTAVENRLKFQGTKEEGRTLVVVTASGGGIHAAGWTAQVLTGLQNCLGTDFTKSIGLISSVSGGSVGSLFFVDYCEENGAISTENLPAVVQDAVQDALDTMGWGLVYRDLGNIVGLPWLKDVISFIAKVVFKYDIKISDRGEALEYSWQNTRTAIDLRSKTSQSPKASPSFVTFDNWTEKALAGKIPIPVFNTTLVEDGRRMLFSPMTFSKSAIDKTDLTVDSNTLYAKHTINAVTAARLSATFPYVSPTSRNKKIKSITHNFHIVDGGYFDNSGIVTAVNWLDCNMDILLKDIGVKRLLLLEIEAFEQTKFNKKQEGRGGFLMAFFAPIKTLLNVKTASLVTRNQQEIDLLIKRYRSELGESGTDEENSKVQHVMAEFPTSEYPQPLSWKLSPSEKYNLEKAWEGVKQDSLQNLWKFWHESCRSSEPTA